MLAVYMTGGAHAQIPDAGLNDLAWYPPNATHINNLEQAINASGTYGFIFNSSVNPPGTSPHTYNYCNMPHIRKDTYPRVSEGYQLEYVELVCPSPFVPSAFRQLQLKSED